MRSAVLVPVPDAEPLVARYRERLDASAAAGVPAHFTIIVPFVPPGSLDPTVEQDLRAYFAGVAPSEVELRIGWFGRELLYLSPDPDDMLRRMIAELWERYPAYPPYEGIHDEVIPHLTVGVGTAESLEPVAKELEPSLPISARLSEALLMEQNDEGWWSVRHRFGFGG